MSAPSLRWVTVGQGKLALRGRPGKDLIARLRELGCDRVVTLLSAHEGAAELGQQIQAAGVAWTWLPLENARAPQGAPDAMLRAALSELSARLDAGEAIVIHCAAGIHRTGMLAYALLRWRGLAPDETRAVIGDLRFHTLDGLGMHHIAWGDAGE